MGVSKQTVLLLTLTLEVNSHFDNRKVGKLVLEAKDPFYSRLIVYILLIFPGLYEILGVGNERPDFQWNFLTR